MKLALDITQEEYTILLKSLEEHLNILVCHPNPSPAEVGKIYILKDKIASNKELVTPGAGA